MKQIWIILSLLIVIIVCSILSGIFYPYTITEKYVDLLSYPQFFLLVKNFAYDKNGVENFYSFNKPSLNTGNIQTLILPTFFAISSLCSESNIMTNYQCLDYNINNISITNKDVNSYIKTCSSIDTFNTPSDALAYTVRIIDDVYLLNKNCMVANNITIDTEVIQSVTDTSSSTVLDDLVNQGITANYQSQALSLAEYSIDKTHVEYNNRFTINIVGSKLCNFIILSRPIFIRIGMSGLYKIEYNDLTSNTLNTINNYSSSQTTSLKLNIRYVTDKKIYNTELMNVKKALDYIKNSSSLQVNCKPDEIINTNGNAFLDKYVKSINITETKQVELPTYNMTLFYLTHSQSEMSNNANTSSISIYKEISEFYSQETEIFEFNSLKIVSVYQSDSNIIKVQVSGNYILELIVNTPDMYSLSVLLTWTFNKMNVVVFYSTNDIKHIVFKSCMTQENCIFEKKTLEQACILKKATPGTKKCTSYITMHDFAISRNLL